LSDIDFNNGTLIPFTSSTSSSRIGLKSAFPEYHNEIDISKKAAPAKSREIGIDIMRLICAFEVVVSHAAPWHQPIPIWVTLMLCGCIPSVPFFFICAGYFLRLPSSFQFPALGRPLTRLITLYVFWVCIYIVLLKLTPVRPTYYQPGGWLTGGPAYHLWFIPALAFAMVYVTSGLLFLGPTITGFACIVPAVIASMTGSYHNLLHIPFHIQHTGQLVGPLYVYIGILLAKYPVSIKWRWLVPGLLLSYGLMVVEEIVVTRIGAEVPRVEILSTFIVGILLFLAARSIGYNRVLEKISKLGQFALGIYAVHLFLLWIFLPIFGNNSPLLIIEVSSLVFVLATIVAIQLSYIPGLKRLVR
jgi:peptidoglycan/LPS O-acetylase OafA/YrhL